MSKTAKVRNLPVVLTEEEQKQRSKRLAERVSKRRELMAERQKNNALTYRELKEVDAEIASLSEIVATGQEVREVEVSERKDTDRRVLEVIRLDTNEVVDSRQLALEELQADLPFARQQGERATSHESRPKPKLVPVDGDAPPPLEPDADGIDRHIDRASNAEAPEDGKPATREALDQLATANAAAPSSRTEAAAKKRRRRANAPEPTVEPTEP